MGLMDNIKQGANSLADSVNKGVANMQQGSAGAPGAPPPNADALLRDLGALTWRDAHGELDEAGVEERTRVMQSLAELGAAGALDLSLRSAAAPPPPPPGAAAAPPPPGGAVAPPPPPRGGAATPPPPAAGTSPPPPQAAPPASAVPPPPPPSSPDALKAPPEH